MGAAASMVTDGIGAGTGIYLFVKNGSAKEVGERLATAIDESVDSSDGGVKGAVKGMGSAAVASAKAAAVTGWREGKGTGSGVVEGVKAARRQISLTRLPKEGLLKSSAKLALGVATGIMAAPAGVVTALATPVDQKESIGPVKRLVIAGASGAALGASVGFLGGPLGVAIGAGIGAAINLFGPASREKFSTHVMRVVRHTERRKEDLGSDIANNNSALFSKGIIGAAAATARAWNIAVRPGEKTRAIAETAPDTASQQAT